jgi:hypothetical protein
VLNNEISQKGLPYFKKGAIIILLVFVMDELSGEERYFNECKGYFYFYLQGEDSPQRLGKSAELPDE